MRPQEQKLQLHEPGFPSKLKSNCFEEGVDSVVKVTSVAAEENGRSRSCLTLIQPKALLSNLTLETLICWKSGNKVKHKKACAEMYVYKCVL